MVQLSTFAAALAALTSIVVAHPGEHFDHAEVTHELNKRAEHAAHIQRGLVGCLNHPEYRALSERGEARRFETAQQLRRERGIPEEKPFLTRRHIEAGKRDLAALEAFEEVNHNMTSLGYKKAAHKKLFSLYKNVSCILTPEVTDGPYYVTGEYVRKNVTEDQEGIPVHLEYQFIDVSTCTAATGLYVDTWQANATGVYSGVDVNSNGDADVDPNNMNATFLRGVQPVTKDGYATFNTIFVGHYEGRASHIHLMAHQNGTVSKNKTYSDTAVTHVGQLFFPTDLKDVVEATYPYNTNTQAITTNDEDMWAPAQADNSYDPFPDYAYLGSDISDGLLMWISIGVDMSADYYSDVTAAGKLTADGGVCNEAAADGCYDDVASYGTASGGSGGGGGGNGTSMTMSGGTMTMSSGNMTMSGSSMTMSGGPSGSPVSASATSTATA